MTKKVTNKTVFPFIAKNLNLEILTKNLVTFKTCDGVKDEKLQGFTGKYNFQEALIKKKLYSGVGQQGLFQKVRAWLQVFKKRQKYAERDKMFENLCKNVQNLKTF